MLAQLSTYQWTFAGYNCVHYGSVFYDIWHLYTSPFSLGNAHTTIITFAHLRLLFLAVSKAFCFMFMRLY